MAATTRRDPGVDDRLGARGLLALMRAGLEGDDQRRPSSPVTGVGQRHRFGVPITVFRMPSLAYQLHRLAGSPHRPAGPAGPFPSLAKREVEGPAHGLPLVHPALEAHSQAEAGEELSLAWYRNPRNRWTEL